MLFTILPFLFLLSLCNLVKTIKALYHLGLTGNDFSDYHVQTAEKIYSLTAEGHLKF